MPAAISTRRKKSKIRTLKARDGEQCWYCLRRFSESLPPTLDHIIPVAKGGTNDNDNLRLACFPCNFRKGARMGIFSRGIWYHGSTYPGSSKGRIPGLEPEDEGSSPSPGTSVKQYSEVW